MARMARGGIAGKIEAQLNGGTPAGAPAVPTPPPGVPGGVSPTGSVTGALPPPRTIPWIPPAAPTFTPRNLPVGKQDIWDGGALDSAPNLGPGLPAPRSVPPPTGPIPAPATPGGAPGRVGPLPFPTPSGGGGGVGGPRGVAGIRRRQPGLGGVGPSQYSLDAFQRGRGKGPQPNVMPGEPAVGRQGTSSSAATFARPSWLPPILP